MCATDFSGPSTFLAFAKSKRDCAAAGMVLMTIVNMLMILLAGSFMGSDGGSAERDLEAGKPEAPSKEPEMKPIATRAMSNYSESLIAPSAAESESQAEEGMRALPSGTSRVGAVNTTVPLDSNLLHVEGLVKEAGVTSTTGAIRI